MSSSITGTGDSGAGPATGASAFLPKSSSASSSAAFPAPAPYGSSGLGGGPWAPGPGPHGPGPRAPSPRPQAPGPRPQALALGAGMLWAHGIKKKQKNNTYCSAVGIIFLFETKNNCINITVLYYFFVLPRAWFTHRCWNQGFGAPNPPKASWINARLGAGWLIIRSARGLRSPRPSPMFGPRGLAGNKKIIHSQSRSG